MKPANPHILTINGGSSSIRFALYQRGEPLKRKLYGKVDRIELNKARNAENAGVISTDASRVTVRVIRTDEERMIALGLGIASGKSNSDHAT